MLLAAMHRVGGLAWCWRVPWSSTAKGDTCARHGASSGRPHAALPMSPSAGTTPPARSAPAHSPARSCREDAPLEPAAPTRPATGPGEPGRCVEQQTGGGVWALRYHNVRP
ncbi:hypothetical protein V2I01_31750 [Micromonospora sp. BRA006-A]|nr:hypothetical protein [Micromonospora sp. BRA006-A]